MCRKKKNIRKGEEMLGMSWREEEGRERRRGRVEEREEEGERYRRTVRDGESEVLRERDRIRQRISRE